MRGLDYVVLRYFNVYGPRMDIHGVYTEVLVRWMERIAGRPGTPDLRRRQADDGLRVRRRHRPGQHPGRDIDVTDEVFNVASGTETSLNDLAAAMLRVMGSSLQPEYGPARAVNAVPRRLADTRKAEEMLGFVAAVDLDEGLRRLVDWWSTERALAELSA